MHVLQHFGKEKILPINLTDALVEYFKKHYKFLLLDNVDAFITNLINTINCDLTTNQIINI